MPAPQQLTQLPLDGRHVFGPGRLHAQQTHHFHAGVILHARKGEDDRVVLNIRKAESLYALTENADHRERHLSHPNRSPDCMVLAKNLGLYLPVDTPHLPAPYPTAPLTNTPHH